MELGPFLVGQPPNKQKVVNDLSPKKGGLTIAQVLGSAQNLDAIDTWGWGGN